ncbi:META domain-containing protein [Allosphingosinicella sp.]|uniref:META domain-containing protein n=1 Tax=Allosphingosinicella sp. TaxID=2823234 RepID=UPI0037849F14
MKLRLVTLALLAVASPVAAQPPEPEGEVYSGFGTEPFWDVTFEDGKIILHQDEERIEVPRPRPTTTRAGVHIYRTPRFTVEISHEGRCNDGMSEFEYADTVRIRFGRSRTGGLEGCGGGSLPPATLANTNWRIIDVAGFLVGDSAYVVTFEDGRLTAQVGCNRLSGPYRQRSHLLTPGPIASTRMACPPDQAEREARLTQLLQGPIRINYNGGTQMTLQSDQGDPNIYLTLLRQ